MDYSSDKGILRRTKGFPDLEVKSAFKLNVLTGLKTNA